MNSPLYNKETEEELLDLINTISVEIQNNPDVPEHYFSRALQYYQLSQQYYDILEIFHVGDKDKYFTYVNQAYNDVDKALSFKTEIDDYAYSFKLFMLKKLKKWEELIEYGEKLCDSIGCTPSDIGLMGEAYFNLDEWQKCINSYTSVINELGENEASNLGTEIFAERGIAYANLEQHEQAIQDFLKDIDFNEPSVFSKYNIYALLGNEYREFGNYEKAIWAYTEELKIYEDDSNTYFRRGQIYCDYLNEYSLASADFDQAIMYSNSDFYLLYHYCGYSYVHKGELNEDKKQALKDFDRAIEMYKTANKLEYDDTNSKEAIASYNATVKYAEHRKEDLLKST